MARISLVSSTLNSKDRTGTHGTSYFQPPLSLCTVAAAIRQHGHAVQIVDPGPLRLSCSQVVGQILSFESDIVGFSATTQAICRLNSIAKECRKKGKITILGGYHVTAKPQKTMERFRGFDYALLGETDQTFPKLLGELRLNRKRPRRVEGLVFRVGDRLIESARGPYLRNLDTLPLPALDLLPDIAKYYQPRRSTVHPLPVFTIVPCRGCGLPCMLCDRTMFGRQKRRHGPYYIFRLIKYLNHNYGIRHILLRDHTFLDDKQSVLALCELLAESNIDVTWSCFTRPDVVDPDLLPEMKRAGCTRLVLGCQPGSQRVIDQLNLKMDVNCIREAVADGKAHGFIVKGEFFVGGFGENPETIEETARLVHELPLDDFSLTMFRPLPGSEAYEIASQFGRVCTDWERCGDEYFLPDGLTKEDMAKAYWRVFKAHYLKPRTLFNIKSTSSTLSNSRKVLKAGLSMFYCPKTFEEHL